jgi:hypothetical protein
VEVIHAWATHHGTHRDREWTGANRLPLDSLASSRAEPGFEDHGNHRRGRKMASITAATVQDGLERESHGRAKPMNVR